MFALSVDFALASITMGAKRASSAAASGPTKKQRQLTPEALAATKLRDDYKGFTPEQTDILRCPSTGLTLRQILVKDCKAWLAGAAIVWGKSYHDEKREIFRASGDVFGALKPPTGSPECGDQLMKAMVALKRPKPERSLMLTYMQTSSDANISEVCGCLRWFITLKPSCRKIQLPLTVKVMEWVVRLDVSSRWSAQWTLVKPWAERVILALYAGVKKQQTKQEFMKQRMDFCLTVLPAEPFKVVQGQPDDKLEHYTQELTALTRAGPVGRMLFDHTMVIVVSKKVADLIHVDVLEFLKSPKGSGKKRLNQQALTTAKAATLKKLLQIEGVDTLTETRAIDLMYGATKLLDVEVKNLVEHVDFSYSAFLKPLGVARKKLVKLKCEDILVSTWDIKCDCDLDDDLFVKYSAARKRINDLMGQHSVATSDQVMKLVLAEAHNLKLIDDTVSVDLAILANLSGDSAAVKFAQAMVACFPDADNDRSATTTLQKLEALRCSDSHKLAPRHVQAHLRHIKKLVGNLVEDSPVNVDSAQADDLLKPVVDAFKFFVRDQKDDGSWVFGEEAMKLKYEKAKAKVAAKSCLPDDVKDLCTFKWLRPDDIKEQIAQLIVKVRNQNQEGLKGLVKGAKKGSGKPSSSKKDDGAVAAALKMFS